MMSASIFVLKEGETKPFDMCSGCSEVYVVRFYLESDVVFTKAASPTVHGQGKGGTFKLFIQVN